jgi:hypothetical protein
MSNLTLFDRINNPNDSDEIVALKRQTSIMTTSCFNLRCNAKMADHSQLCRTHIAGQRGWRHQPRARTLPALASIT